MGPKRVQTLNAGRAGDPAEQTLALTLETELAADAATIVVTPEPIVGLALDLTVANVRGAAKVSALANDDVAIRTDAITMLSLTRLSGATTGKPARIRAGIIGYASEEIGSPPGRPRVARATTGAV